jgi:hypothetical protein
MPNFLKRFTVPCAFGIGWKRAYSRLRMRNHTAENACGRIFRRKCFKHVNKANVASGQGGYRAACRAIADRLGRVKTCGRGCRKPGGEG